MSKQDPINAEDLLAELANDPEYQRKMQEKDHKRQAQRKILDEDQKDLVFECCKAGVEIKSVWDLVNTTGSYAAAIPVLVKHLEIAHHPKTVEGIVRALSTPEARGNANVLIRMFLSEDDSECEMKWLLGAAIAETATAADAMSVVELIGDEKHGSGREFLPLALVHSPKNAAVEILKPLLKDPVMGDSAAKAIRLLRTER